MDFSDDSFVWSDASNDSDAMAFDINQEECDESEINNDRKVQEKSPADKQKKSKKRKHEDLVEVNGSDYKHKHIKSEPESDFDLPRKKKKKDHEDTIPKEELQESFNDSYLNYRVKQEQSSFVEPVQVKPKKKKRHKRESEAVASEEHDSETSDQKIEVNGEDFHIEDTFVKEEVEVKKKKKKNKDDTIVSSEVYDNSDEDQAKKKNKKKEKVKNNDHDNSQDSHNNNSMLIDNNIDDKHIKEKHNGDISHKSLDKTTPLKEISKISDRLRFEDEDSEESEPKENVDNAKLSKHLKKYINANKNLSLISSEDQNKSIFSADDEIWIIKGPHGIDVKDFKNVNIKLDTKCKLKLNGQTYESVIDNCVEKVPILKYNKNKLHIENVPVMGIMNLRKRIPKAHIPEDNIMINNQTNFIPLPDTKCRHPLFGADYKKATKIPRSVAERLNDSVIVTSIDNQEKKKKHKKEKKKVEIESELETKPVEISPVIPSKKKRKRKLSIKDEFVPKKAKYIKDDPDCAEAWESEKAIEKNLFDF